MGKPSLLDPFIAAFADTCRRAFGQDPQSFVYPGGYKVMLKQWNHVCHSLEVAFLQPTPAGLRGGGATDFHLRFANLDWLQRRGRWRSRDTLDHYVQESTYIMTTLLLPKLAQQRVTAFVSLGKQLIHLDHLPPQPPSL